MTKKLDEATKMLIESLSENMQNLAFSAVENGYFSQSDFTEAINMDEIPDSEQAELLDFFQQDLGLEMVESENFSKDMDRYYREDEDEDDQPRDKSRDLLNAEAEQVDVNEEDYDHYAKQLERSQTGSLVLGVQDSVQSYLKQIGTVPTNSSAAF